MKSWSPVFLALGLVLGGSPTLEAAPEEPVWKARPGPWGELEVRSIYMEAPDSLLAAVAKPNSVTRWVFEQTTEGAVRSLLQRCGVPAPLGERLLDPARRIVSGNVLSLYPSPEDLVAIPPAARGLLYQELAKSPA
ncbi:MAG: hypothetical protein ACKO3A_04210, partial [Opitutia bacterium]